MKITTLPYLMVAATLSLATAAAAQTSTNVTIQNGPTNMVPTLNLSEIDRHTLQFSIIAQCVSARGGSCEGTMYFPVTIDATHRFVVQYISSGIEVMAGTWGSIAVTTSTTPVAPNLPQVQQVFFFTAFNEGPGWSYLGLSQPVHLIMDPAKDQTMTINLHWANLNSTNFKVPINVSGYFVDCSQNSCTGS
jgi:hypothetical protein